MIQVIGLVGWPGSIQNIVVSIFKKKVKTTFSWFVNPSRPDQTGHIKSTSTRFNLKLGQVMTLHNESSMSIKIN